MKTLRLVLTAMFTLIAGAGDPAHAHTLFHTWDLTMSDIQAQSRVSLIRGERRQDCLGRVRVRGILAERRGSGSQPEQLYFDVNFMTLLIRNTEYDPDFLRTSFIAGYRHRRAAYTIDLFAEHVRRMNTDRVGRLNVNFFGAGLSDPEFENSRFGKARRIHGRIAAGNVVNENGFSAGSRCQLAARYDYREFQGTAGRANLPVGQIFIEGEADAIHGPGGFMTDYEAGVRFLFLPKADNSLSVAVKYYDSKNPLGHGEDGVRLDLDLEGGHAGELFKSFLGNTAGEIVAGYRGEDVAAELAADFDLIRLAQRGRTIIIILDTLQRATWGFNNKIEYNLQTGAEVGFGTADGDRGDERAFGRVVTGVYLDHRSTHGLDRNLIEENYNLIRLGLKTPGWDPGRENETLRGVAAQLSIGNYIENSFKKTRKWDGRVGLRIDGKSWPWGDWTIVPYIKGTLRNATDQKHLSEVTAETGIRMNGHSLFLRYSQDAYFGEGGFGGLALRF